jgi:hypothetical protein
MATPHTIELALDHEGRLRELQKVPVSKFGIYAERPGSGLAFH